MKLIYVNSNHPDLKIHKSTAMYYLYDHSTVPPKRLAVAGHVDDIKAAYNGVVNGKNKRGVK